MAELSVHRKPASAAKQAARLIARHPERHIATGASTIVFREAGAGPALVLLHGIGSGSASWVQQLEGLADRYRLLAWDAPGYGGSSALAQPAPQASDYAAALERLLDALALERIVLVGHSLGALIAARFAAERCERLRGLVLLAPARGYGKAPAEVRERTLAERLETMAKLGPERHAIERAHALLGPNASALARELVIWNGARLDPTGYAQAARMLAGADIFDDAERYAGPVLVACGSEDRITPENSCRAIAERFPRADYRALAGLGHACYVEDPPEVNRLLADFAAAVSA